MLGAYDVTRDRLYGHVKKRKKRTEFLGFCRYVRSLYPAEVRLDFILDNFSPPPRRRRPRLGPRQQRRARLHPHYGSWLYRIEAQFKALRYFTLDGTDHPDHATQARLIRRYIAWRNYNVDGEKLRAVVNTANVA